MKPENEGCPVSAQDLKLQPSDGTIDSQQENHRIIKEVIKWEK
jgi:hypothetical protein